MISSDPLLASEREDLVCKLPAYSSLEKLWNYKHRHYSRLPSPKHYKARTTGLPFVAQGKQAGAARALHYDGDYNNHGEREIRVRDGRGLRRLQRQELLSWLYVIVCVTTITSTWRRKRDWLLWSLPQERRHKEKGATTTHWLGRPLW